MLEQIRRKVDRFEEIERLLADPAVASQPARYAALMKERGQLQRVVAPYRELERVQKQKREAQALLEDPELKAEARAEVAALETRETELIAQLEEIALTADPHAARSVIVEIRPGVGGEEACLFARELLEMYMRYAQRKGWQVQLMDVVHTDLGGLKYGTLAIEGEDVYKHLKYETGAHRVQRVPKTEASGRIHTSIATVAVLPEAEEVEVDIKPEDVRVDTYSAGGPGGQHVNKTQSAVRLTHLPTGIVVQCQDQRSQTRNRELAWRWLRARLYEHYEEQRARERRELRRTQVGTGDRSEKIRTYNFHDNRITDHRIGFTVHQLDAFLKEGELDEMIRKLQEAERRKKLEALGKKPSGPPPEPDRAGP
jgi:peptide chain release factor 1